MTPMIHRYATLHLFQVLSEIDSAEKNGHSAVSIDISGHQLGQVQRTTEALTHLGYEVYPDEYTNTLQIYW